MATNAPEDRYSFANIKKEIYPYLEPALKKLLDEVNRNEQISRYQLRLAKKKIYDRCEQKFIQKEKMRMELGDQYSSSDEDDEVDYDFLGVSKKHLTQLIRNKLQEANFSANLLKNSLKHQQDKINEGLQQQTNGGPSYPPMVDSALRKEGDSAGGLVEIKENDDEDEDRFQNMRKFNPVLFLADTIQKMYKQNRT